jgi:hypothetical protein
MAEVYMILLRNVDIISKDYKGVFKKIIGSKVNTNAITEANFKLQRMVWVFYKKSIPNNPLHNSTIAHFK